MFYLEKTGWERPKSKSKSPSTDFDKSIAFFKRGPWSRLNEEQKHAIAKAY